MSATVKFLTIARFKDAFFQLSKEERSKLIAESMEIVLEYKKTMGDKFRFFTNASYDGLVSITEFNSIEEYARSLQTPGATAGYIVYESTPLIEMDESAMHASIQVARSQR